MSGSESAAVNDARQALDAHVAETVAWHFHESTGCPFWLEFKRQLKFDPLNEVRSFDDLQEIPAVRRRMAPRRAGAALGAQGFGRQADLRLRNRRHDRRSQEPHRHRRLSHRLLAVQRHAAGQVFSARRELADARPVRAAAACGWPSSIWPSIAAASASASTSIRAGSSSSSRRAGWSISKPTSSTASIRRSRFSAPATTSSACSPRRS